jgi:predicted helicase
VFEKTNNQSFTNKSLAYKTVQFQNTLLDSVTLGGIPPETFDYQLGNRSALDWVIAQYRIRIDKRSGIVNDPNFVWSHR